MPINTTSWNRRRYAALAPFYDGVMRPVEALAFRRARRRAVELLAPRPGARVLIVGAGTGLDLEALPRGLEIVATDLSAKMIARLERRAERLGLAVEARVMDGERLDLAPGSFDHAVLHLVLAVMPEPRACAREVRRVLAPGGTVSVFDKFVADGERPSLARRLVNPAANLVATDLTRELGPILAAGDLELVHREPAVLGLFTVALARAARGGAPGARR